MKTALVAMLILSLCVFADTVSQRIVNDENLTTDQRALYLALSVLAPERLSLEYTNNTEPERSGTPALHEATLLFDEISSSTLEEILTLANRPVLSGSPLTFVSPDGHFRIHYTTTGADATTLDYANNIAGYMDYAWAIECGPMGYINPPPDNNAGGDNLYDVYVIYLSGGTLGYTSSGGEYQPPDSTHSSSASHIAMGTGNTESTCMVTSSHEFQHAIQMTYDYEEPTWFMENCAVWMEDQVYDDDNDYYGYHSEGSIRNPHMKIDSGNPYWYGASYWPRMIGLMYEVEAVREVWENCAAVEGPNMWDALEATFATHGSSFENGFMEYGIWRFMIGSFWNNSFNMYDDEAEQWNGALVLPWNNVSTLPHTGDQGEHEEYIPKTTGISYIRVKLEDYQGGWVQMAFDGRDGFEWNLGVFVFNDNDFQFMWYNCDPSSGEKTVAVPTTGWDYAVFFPAFMTSTTLSGNYDYTVDFSTGIEQGEEFTSTALTIGTNPVTPGSAVSFNLPSAGHADLSVIDLTGRRVSTLFSGDAEKGIHSVEFQGELASGTYFVVLRHENSVESARVSVIR